MKKIVAFGFIGLALLVIAHHWLTHGFPADMSNVLCHEFLVALCIGIAIGGLIL